MAKTDFKQPYVIRRLFYGILALVGAVLVGFGVAEAVQVDQWTEALDRIITPILLMVGGGVAGAKANPGSDMKKPVEAERVAPTPAAPAPSPAHQAGNELLHNLRSRIEAARK